MIVIPAIDLKDGRCVRLLKGEFDQVTEYQFDPMELAASYRDAGCTLLHLVDLDGARDGRPGNEKIIRQLSVMEGVSIQVGGGLRTEGLIETVLETGVKRVVLGSIAMLRPQAALQWLKEFGASRIVLALDARLDAEGVPRLSSHGWTRDTGQSLWEALDLFAGAGLIHVLCTDIDRDGAMTGPNLELYAEFLARYPQLEVQASGGVRDADDLRALDEAGVQAAIVGKALLDGRITAEELGPFLRKD